MELCEWLEQKGFTDNNGYFTICNENEEGIGDSIEEWAKENCEQYSIDFDQVFESPGLDIYCYSVGYVKCGKVYSNLISCYLY